MPKGVMRILFFISSLSLEAGGPSRSVPMMAKGLTTLGVDVTLATVKPNEICSQSVSNIDIPVYYFNQGLGKSEIKAYLISNRFDLIQLQSIWDYPYHYFASVARSLGIPYIFTPRGMLEPWSLHRKRLKKSVALALYQKRDLCKAAAIHATAEVEAEHVRDLGISTSIAVIPNGIDILDYPIREPSTRTTIKKRVLFLSRIHPKKGLEVLLKAWESVNKTNPGWELVIAGNGEESYIKSIEMSILKNGMRDSVHISPPVYGLDKYNLYCSSSVFILPSYSENFGMVIAEALSCGLPVITTKETPWEILSKTGTGWWVDMNVDCLTEALSSAIGMGTDALFEMGQKGSKIVRDNYQYQSVARKSLALYQWILGVGSKPDFMYE